jgi:hypothetical protein
VPERIRNMETATSDRHARWVTSYAIGVTTLGVLMILGGLAYGAGAAFEWFPKRERINNWVALMALVGAVSICVTGLLTIALSKLVCYVIGAAHAPGWVLRNASRGLFLLAALRVMGSAAHCLYDCQVGRSWSIESALNLLSTISSVLILIALGLAMNRSLPIIEESRTLV